MSTSPDSVTYTQSINEIVGPTEAAPWENTLRPTNPWPGLFGFDTLTERFEFYDGTAWRHPFWTEDPYVFDNVSITGTLGVTGLASFASQVTTSLAYVVDGLFSYTTTPWSVRMALSAQTPGTGFEATRDLTRFYVESDLAQHTNPERENTLTTLNIFHTFGKTGTPAASGPSGSRVVMRASYAERSPPLESTEVIGPSTRVTGPQTSALFIGIRHRYGKGGTAPIQGLARGSSFVQHASLIMDDGSINHQSQRVLEMTVFMAPTASSRLVVGTALNPGWIQGFVPTEGFWAYTSAARNNTHAWRSLFHTGGQGVPGMDPYSGYFATILASNTVPFPRAKGGIQFADATFIKSTFAWAGGEILGGDRGVDETGGIRLGNGFLLPTEDGLSLDVTGSVGLPTGTILSLGVDLVNGDPLVPARTSAIGDDDYGGTYRFYGVDSVTNEFTRCEVVNPPVVRGATPSNPIEVRLRDVNAGVMDFMQNNAATTTTATIPIVVTEPGFFVGKYLAYYNGPAAGERRVITDYTDGVVTTAAFSTTPTDSVNLVTNPGFALPISGTEGVVLNGWSWDLNGGTGTVTQIVSPPSVDMVSDGTNATDIRQEITTYTADTDGAIFVVSTGPYTLLIGTTAGGDDILNENVAPAVDGDGNWIQQNRQSTFYSDASTVYVTIQTFTTQTYNLKSVKLASGTDGTIVNGIRSGIEAVPLTVNQTWTAISELKIQPSGGATLIGGDIQFDNAATFAANDTTATVLGSVGPAGAGTAVAKWLRIKDEGGADLVIPAWSYTPP